MRFLCRRYRIYGAWLISESFPRYFIFASEQAVPFLVFLPSFLLCWVNRVAMVRAFERRNERHGQSTSVNAWKIGRQTPFDFPTISSPPLPPSLPFSFEPLMALFASIFFDPSTRKSITRQRGKKRRKRSLHKRLEELLPFVKRRCFYRPFHNDRR